MMYSFGSLWTLLLGDIFILLLLLLEYDGGVGDWWEFRESELSAVSMEYYKTITCCCSVSFKDAISEKKRQQEKRLAEEKAAAEATTSENVDTTINDMEEDESTDGKS